MDEYFRHPLRFPKNAPGPFYTTGHQDRDGVWCGDCLWCGAPEDEAPDLLAELNDENFNTYFVRQPQTEQEVEHACNAVRVCCTSALRYGGTDKAILKGLGNDPEYCDYLIDKNGNLQPAFHKDEQPTAEATDYWKRHGLKARKRSPSFRPWWKFWS